MTADVTPSPPSHPATALLRALCPCVLLAAFVGGCTDADSPAAVLLTEESRTALVLRPELPGLPGLAERAGIRDEIAPTVERWIASWEGAADGEVRAGIYDEAVGLLARSLGPAGVAEARTTLGSALAAVQTVESSDIPPELRTHVQRAERLHADAGPALSAGRDAEALHMVLRGADALREVGPEGVARFLIHRGQGVLEDSQRRQTALPVDVERAERMLNGAALALEDGDWERALRRAYYACQLLGVATR